MQVDDNTLESVSKFFVARNTELTDFQKLLQNNGNGSPPVFCVTGDNEIGKTWLLHRCYKECLGSGTWRPLPVFFSLGNLTDYVTILRDIHGTLGQPFPRYQRSVAERLKLELPAITVNTGEGDGGTGAEISGDAQLEDVSISGQFAGRDINQFYFQVSNSGESLRQLDVIQGITKAFREDLIEYSKKEPVVFFFDDIGSDFLVAQTRTWLIKEFVVPLSNQEGIRFVLTQREAVGIDIKSALINRLQNYHLEEFKGDEPTLFAIYRKYLSENHGMGDISDRELRMYHKLTNGFPAQMFLVALDLR